MHIRSQFFQKPEIRAGYPAVQDVSDNGYLLAFEAVRFKWVLQLAGEIEAGQQF